jgi:hypothetical protein
MNMPTKSEVIRILLTVSLFFSLFLILAGLNYTMRPLAAAAMKSSADPVIKEWNGKKSGLGKEILTPGIGWAYHVFHVEDSAKRDDRVFIVRITGNSGPYTAVFYYTPQQGTKFCGLAGFLKSSGNEESYGITDRIVRMWTKKLDSVAVQAEEKK